LPYVMLTLTYLHFYKEGVFMCSIMGYCTSGVSFDEFKKYFDRTISRGPDDTRIIYTGDGLIGFHRLAIMGLTDSGMQPFELDGSYLVCNGEIYGFKKFRNELEGKYTFHSDSDCEVLLPLYKEYGVEMFKMLDAEFACILYDSESCSWIAARDPIGIRPLYYGYDSKNAIVFASEAKNLVGLCKKIKPFPPGYYYKDGEFKCYRDIAAVEKYVYDDIDTVCKNIREKLIAGIEKRLIADAKVGFLLSGGLDSSLVCSVAAKKSESPIRTFAIGMSEDAIDLKYAKEVAEYIGSEHTEVIISKDDVISSLETVISILGTFDITTIRASIGMYLVCKAIHETTDIRVLLTGEISDELFGYKYTDFAPSAEEFQKEAQKRLRELHTYDVLRADRCISVNSLEARVPFGDLDFVKYVMSIDPEKKMNKYKKGKYLLRHAFEGDYLPHDILYREKAAFSDAVGHSMVDHLKEYAEHVYTDSEFKEKAQMYGYCTPFTKESLLYREIFEKYYPGQAEMIPDFWMPNKAWEGCAVDDPSARVLSNYGDSGK
jgi:asparagine synthase (glutamine-hydrolysing)